MRGARVALGLVVLAACRKSAPLATQEAGTSDDASVVAAQTESGDAMPRCSIRQSVGLGSAGAPETADLEVGAGVSAPSGAFVGVVRTVEGARLASVAKLTRGSAPSFIDLGSVAREAPPPTLFVRGTDVFAVGYVLPGPADAGNVGLRGSRVNRASLFRLSGAADAHGSPPPALLVLPDVRGEPSAVDVAATPAGSPVGAAVAWDEDAPDTRAEAGHADGGEIARGVIRLATLDADQRSVAHAEIVSPDTTDADRPRVALRDGGFWVVWVARKTEPHKEGSPELEGPGEDRAYRWVELLALDAQGRPSGGVRRLTSTTGHVAGFEMVATPPLRLDVFVGFDEERGEGTGGSVAHVVVEGDGPPRMTPIVSEAVGRADAPWVAWKAGTPGWLFCVDLSDHTLALPLDAQGGAGGVASQEPSFDDARPVSARAAVSGEADVLAVTSAHRGELRWISCSQTR